ncbi:hypothetical protein [Actinopolymorpha rutila]|uniref:Uncharacterized protein n=1 Tax=Actinopolymorpha rutila TaxID=446787 RepID=A0A852Z6Z1_9ACTN|nr:hypothetical protein [Actinopolymorpha rutila]NYH87652.1 hypothetical protein [Actinopolymorpha rutila]
MQRSAGVIHADIYPRYWLAEHGRGDGTIAETGSHTELLKRHGRSATSPVIQS